MLTGGVAGFVQELAAGDASVPAVDADRCAGGAKTAFGGGYGELVIVGGARMTGGLWERVRRGVRRQLSDALLRERDQLKRLALRVVGKPRFPTCASVRGGHARVVVPSEATVVALFGFGTLL